ncbi:MAG: ADOP family duplicated permease [Bryobacteraceae bacterium]
MFQDIRYALRNMRRKPGVTAVVVASLALGIGANLALFSVVYPALLRPLAVSHPEELVELLQKYPGEPRGNGYWTTRSFEHYRAHTKAFADLTATAINHVTRVEIHPPELTQVVGESVAGNYFSMLGVRAEAGRVLGEEDTGRSVAVLSWPCWQARFGGDRAVLGRRIVVNGSPVEIVGVAARTYTGLLANAQTCIWTQFEPAAGQNLIARLRPGVTLDAARAEMRVLYQFTIDERAAGNVDPQVRKLQVEVEPGREGLNVLRDRVGQPLWMLMALVSVLLLLACVNTGGILLAQAAAREREFALRSGLGASRWRLVRQVLTESCLLSVLGAAAGIAVAYAGTAILLGILDSGRRHERVHLMVEVDGTVVLFATLVAVLTGLIFGLAPAMRCLRPAALQTLRQTGLSVQSRSQRLLGKALVTAQVAIALLLMSMGALFSANLALLRSKDLGFRADHVLLVPVEAARGYRGEQLASQLHEALERLRNLPAVRSVSLGAPTPLMGAGASGWLIAEGFEEKPEEKRRISISWVAPRYFETLGIPLRAGRDFAASDEVGPKSAILSESAARYYFGGRDPVGRKITLDKVTLTRDPATYEVVGVVGDANYREIRETDLRQVYLSAFGPGRVTARTLVVRSAIRPEGLASDVRRTMGEVAPGLGIGNVSSLPAQIDASIVPERLVATLSGFFAVVGALLAGIGLYGLLAYTVTRRTHELGIRMALGATAGQVVRLILAEAVAVAVVGLLVGVPLVVWCMALAARLIPDLTATPAAGIGAGAAMLAGVAAVASWIPACRAARVDAIECLRQE